MSFAASPIALVAAGVYQTYVERNPYLRRVKHPRSEERAITKLRRGLVIVDMCS